MGWNWLRFHRDKGQGHVRCWRKKSGAYIAKEVEAYERGMRVNRRPEIEHESVSVAGAWYV